MVFDFKQKFLAKGFREGGDSYYGKKGILWWGAGVYVKADSKQDGRCISESCLLEKRRVLGRRAVGSRVLGRRAVKRERGFWGRRGIFWGGRGRR